MRRVALIAAALLFTCCTGGTIPPADACGTAFAIAGGEDQNADSVSDLYPAVRACTTIAAWSAAFDAIEGAGFSGSAIEVLRNVCMAPEVANEPLCASLE